MTTLGRRGWHLMCVLAMLSVLGAVLDSSAGRAGTPSASTGTATVPAATGTTTTGPTATGTTTTGTTTAQSTTSPTLAPVACKECTPDIDIGAVTRPLLGFGYGGRRYRNGGIELVAVIITGDDNPAISRLTISLPAQLSRDLPTAKRHLIRVQSGHIEVTGRTIIVTLPKAITDETVTIPAAAMARPLLVTRRLNIGLMFQVRQHRLSRRLGSEVAIG